MFNYQLYARILRLWNDHEEDCLRRTPNYDYYAVIAHYIAQDKELVWC